jgi:CO/xanthine dehydrogenase Mo-binding subunit
MRDDDRPNPSRRLFLSASLAAGGLVLGAVVGCRPRAAGAGEAPAAGAPFAPNAFLEIGRDGRVTLTMPYVEMGQGVYTSVPMLVAEELDVPLDRVILRHAPADEAHYANPILKLQMTGGSTTTRAAWLPLRQAGAAARAMLVGAAARQWKVDPAACTTADGEVLHAASGRRLCYAALLDGAAAQPLPRQVELKAPAAFRLIGKTQRRLDSAHKVDGSALFGIDAQVPGMKFAALAQAPVHGGTLKRVDASKALALKSVRQLVKLDDCVAIVADHTGAARKGLALLDIAWDDGPNAHASSASIARELAAAASGPAARVRQAGDPGAVQGKRIEAVYEQPFQAHAAMEPANCTVHVTADGCELWTGTQVMARARAAAAAVLGIAPERVTVHNHYLGGSFGRRLEVDMVTRAVQIARQVDGPVKIIWSREEDVRHDMLRGVYLDRISATVDAAGMPLAWHHRIAGPSTLRRYLPVQWHDGYDHETVEGALEPPYAFPNFLLEYANYQPFRPTSFWRGVGPSHNVFVVESFVDELAAAAGKDPVAYRMALLGDDPRARAVLAAAAGKADWGAALPAGQGRGVSLQHAFGSWIALVTEVAVDQDGTVAVKRVVAAVDPGVVINPDTVAAQVQSAVVFGISAALWGEVTIADGRVQQSNFHDVRVLRMNEMPSIETHIVASGEAPGGMGEAGTAALFPSLLNAIHAATGKRLRRLPVGEQLKGRMKA